MITVYAENIYHQTYVEAIWLVNYTYLHGRIEEENGFDLACVTAEKELPTNDDIYDVNVIFADGSEHKAKMYYWSDASSCSHHGLIVYPDDTEAVEYAEKCMKEKREYL